MQQTTLTNTRMSLSLLYSALHFIVWFFSCSNQSLQ